MVTMNAGLDDLAFPVQFGFEVALALGDERDVERAIEAEGAGLFVGEGCFVGGVVLVKGEGGGEGGFEACDG